MCIQPVGDGAKRVIVVMGRRPLSLPLLCHAACGLSSFDAPGAGKRHTKSAKATKDTDENSSASCNASE
jgi:hypothetical protein